MHQPSQQFSDFPQSLEGVLSLLFEGTYATQAQQISDTHILKTILLTDFFKVTKLPLHSRSIILNAAMTGIMITMRRTKMLPGGKTVERCFALIAGGTKPSLSHGQQ